MHASDLSISENLFLAHELALVEIRCIRVERPVVPIFEHTFVAELSDAIVERFNLVFLLHNN